SKLISIYQACSSIKGLIFNTDSNKIALIFICFFGHLNITPLPFALIFGDILESDSGKTGHHARFNILANYVLRAQTT
ncbi:hypothetical protein, partial [Citrobacter freundii]|uniref:hypothetical protein n=1 Tax=Citrobacter freundii TaxID=546 RepID=UPI001CD33357